jgi:hypothetical protein
MKDITIKAQAGTVTPQGAVRAAILPPKLLDDFLITSSSGVTRLEITSTDIVRESKASPESAGVYYCHSGCGVRSGNSFPLYQLCQ